MPTFDYYAGSTGTDGGNGLTPATAFSLTALNTTLAAGTLAGKVVGMLDTYGGGTELDLSAPLAVSGSVGVTLKSATPGSKWAARQSRILTPGDWTKTAGATNIYQAHGETESQSNTTSIVLESASQYGLSRPYNRLVGTYFADVSASMDSTEGSSWTGPTSAGDPTIRSYIHAWGSTDPRSDGKFYEHSYLFGDNGIAAVTIYGATVSDMMLLGPCWRSVPASANNLNLANGTSVVCHAHTTLSALTNSYVATGGKHCVANIDGDANGNVLFDGVQAEWGDPYSDAAGSNTVWVVFVSTNNGINAVIRNCTTINNRALVGSTVGQVDRSNQTIYSHTSTPAKTLNSYLVDGCYFPLQTLTLGGPMDNVFQINNTRFGQGLGSNFTMTRCFVDYGAVSNGSLVDGAIGVCTLKNNVFRPICTISAGHDSDNRVAGTWILDHNDFDMSNVITNVSRPYMFETWTNPLSMTASNNIVIQTSSVNAACGFITTLRHGTDTYAGTHNQFVDAQSHPFNNWILYSTTGYANTDDGSQQTLDNMKANGIEDASSQQTATIALAANYVPTVPTPVRSTTGGDVGAFQVPYKQVTPAIMWNVVDDYFM